MIWLGVDLGTRRIGVAVSDDEGERASPCDTLETKPGHEAEQVGGAARSASAGGVVLGLPVDMSGREGLAARRTRRIGSALRKLAPELTVEFFDERLTSKQAERALSASGKRQRAQRGEVDRVAATLLLQAFLDMKNRARTGTP